ncbi:MAG: hypothetical protein H0T65_04880 [Deltaproteobacteria bacterium]|nr:hypothetical protein [Deltaproteobacteria bacterium]
MRADTRFDSVRVFSSTLVADRLRLGERVTEWIASNPQCTVTEVIVTQSSDSAYHCLTFTLFFRQAA